MTEQFSNNLFADAGWFRIGIGKNHIRNGKLMVYVVGSPDVRAEAKKNLHFIHRTMKPEKAIEFFEKITGAHLNADQASFMMNEATRPSPFDSDGKLRS